MAIPSIDDIAVFKCISGQEKDGKIVFVEEGSNLYEDMLSNPNYECVGYTSLFKMGVE